MATETLKLEITANNKAAVAALKETTSQLDAVGSHATATTNKLGTLSKGSNQAANALSNLGRVAQDAPFGFIGIQNNLNPLLESFQRLKAETGSTGGALKALGSSLMGAGGLGFALSAASALFLVFGDSMMSASKETLLATKSQQDFADAMSKAVGNAQQEIVQLNALVAIVNDTTQSTENRKRALDELKKTYEGNIELQKIDINDGVKLAGIIDDISAALLRKARANAFANLIAEEEAKIARAQATSLQDAQDKASGLGKAFGMIGKAASLFGNDLLKQGAAIKAAESGYSNITKEVTTAKSNIQAYTKLLNQNTVAQIQNNDAAKIAGKEAAIDYGPAIRTYRYEAPKSKYKEKRVQSSATGMPEAPQGEVGDNTAVQSAMELGRALEAQKGALAAYNEYMTEAGQLTNFAAQAFTDLGNAMLQGQNLGDALGNVFKKLAADIAAAAIKALIFQTILSAISGGSSTAIAGAAGKSTGGFGKLFKGFLGLGKGFAEGGIASGPKSGHLQLLHGTEAIFPMDKLAAYTDRAISAGMNMGSMGGPQQIQVSGRLVGNDIWLSQKRTDYQRGLTT